MKPGFQQKLLNGPFDDPCLFIKFPWEKHAILFDIGDISRLSFPELFRISDVFVTHAHIDHFIGFDMLLRAVLRREAPLNIYGPPALTRCVEGKLRGYTWNLIREYPTVLNVYAYDGKTVAHSVFRAKNGFRKEKTGSVISDGLLVKGPAFEVRAARLFHGTPCLAFSLRESLHINIDKDLLLRKGLSPGPWLTEFKTMLRHHASGSRKICIGGTSFHLRELSAIARITRGQKLSYATDVAMTRRNIQELTHLVKDSDVFYCESYFMEKDRQRAQERFHLTAKTCGTIARKAGVKRLVLMHFSPKYSDCPDEVAREAMEEFQRQE